MAISTLKTTLTLVGTTGNVDTARPLNGTLKAVYVKYTGQATPSLTIKTKGDNAPSLNLLVLASAGTDGWFFPEQAAAKAADGSAITTWFEQAVLDDAVNIAVTAGGQAGSIDVWLRIDG